eukprot:2913161-Amphidinium_carterae.1
MVSYGGQGWSKAVCSPRFLGNGCSQGLSGRSSARMARVRSHLLAKQRMAPCKGPLLRVKSGNNSPFSGKQGIKQTKKYKRIPIRRINIVISENGSQNLQLFWDKGSAKTIDKNHVEMPVSSYLHDLIFLLLICFSRSGGP